VINLVTTLLLLLFCWCSDGPGCSDKTGEASQCTHPGESPAQTLVRASWTVRTPTKEKKKKKKKSVTVAARKVNCRTCPLAVVTRLITWLIPALPTLFPVRVEARKDRARGDLLHLSCQSILDRQNTNKREEEEEEKVSYSRCEKIPALPTLFPVRVEARKDRARGGSSRSTINLSRSDCNRCSSNPVIAGHCSGMVHDFIQPPVPSNGLSLFKVDQRQAETPYS
jgi:hypothetical protein